MKIFHTTLIAILLVNTSTLFAQSKSYAPEDVINEKFGIQMYEPLNMMLGGDTVRNDANGYAANGFIEDFYFCPICEVKINTQVIERRGFINSNEFVFSSPSKFQIHKMKKIIKKYGCSYVIRLSPDEMKWNNFKAGDVLEVTIKKVILKNLK